VCVWVCVCVCGRMRADFMYTYYLFFQSYMHSYFQCLSPPFVNTLLIMYTHESITGHRGLSYRHFAAFIQRFFGNNFPRRTHHTHLYNIYTSFYIHIIRAMYIGTAPRFTTVLIPTSIPHREYMYLLLDIKCVYMMYINK